jgi:TRAP-type mannitol/chloroaromatic compound transport system permease small subunit
MNVQRLLYTIDAISTWVGKAVAWLIIVLMAVVCVEVVKRYILNAPTAWIFDAENMIYGTLFMLAGAYTLSRNAHVRGDFLYRAWSARTQAKWDLALYILFFFPGMLAFVYAGYGYAKLSWMMNEHSSASPFGPPVYHFKMLIPIVGVLMVSQGVVEVIRCVQCIQTGEWPQRLHDVEELDKIMLEKAEHGEYAVVKELEEIGQRKGSV